MTLIVNRDTAGSVSVSYTEGAASFSVSAPKESVSFADAYTAPDAEPVSTPAAPAEEQPAPAPVAAVEPAPPAPAEAAPPLPGDAAEPASDGPDNAKPFKCPSCGATYDEQLECANGHPAVQTLPTADVLAGAADPLDELETSAPSSPALEPALPQADGGAGTQTTDESSGSSGSAIVSSEPGAEQQAFPGQ